MVKITARIDGMMCGMCETHVNEAIRGAFPVKKVTSSHKKGEAVILADEDIKDGALAAALEQTGYALLSAKHEPYEKKGWFQK